MTSSWMQIQLKNGCTNIAMILYYEQLACVWVEYDEQVYAIIIIVFT